MILLADSGSTKTMWCLVDDNEPAIRIRTKGINPFFQTQQDISLEIEKELLPQLGNKKIEAVYFYGAGCAFPEKNEIVSTAISHYIKAPVEIGSDLLGAARSLCGSKAGIACILGTGSNSCYYDGNRIVENVSPLGFILGDEGSGAALGKSLVSDCLKNQLSSGLQEKFFSQFNLSRAEILDHVYKQPFPNRFLAAFSYFISQNIHEPEIYNIVYEGFKSFFTRNVMQYEYEKYSVHFTGSIAFIFQEILHSVVDKLGIKIGDITNDPIKGLINYHLQ